MKCSVELPISFLQYSDYVDFEFVIASTCLKYPEYKKYFVKSKRMMILDNGAFETGEAIPDDVYIELTRELQPDILIIPDVFKDNAATGIRAGNFLNEWKKNPVANVELMGVLQGNTAKQLMGLYNFIYKPAGVKYYGLGYGTEMDRFQFLQAHPEIENVHILGLPILTEAIGLATLPNVMSLDSSLPIKVTKQGKTLLTQLSAGVNVDSCTPSTDTTLNPMLLITNLQIFQKICNGQFDLSVTFTRDESEVERELDGI